MCLARARLEVRLPLETGMDTGITQSQEARGARTWVAASTTGFGDSAFGGGCPSGVGSGWDPVALIGVRPAQV